MRTGLALVSLVWCAVADEATIPFDDLELLPVPQHRWEVLECQNRELFRALERNHAMRAQQLTPHRDEAPLQKRLRALLREEGIGREVLERLRRFPAGPRRAARRAHAVVSAHAPQSQRRRVTDLVHAVDAAQFVLVQQQERLEGAFKRLYRVSMSFHWAIWRIEIRFWQAIDYLLGPDEKRACREELPREYRTWADSLEHMRFLPDLTLGQAGRLRSLEKEAESERALDEALEERLQRRAFDTDLGREDRSAAMDRLDEVHARLVQLQYRTHELAWKVLTPEQRAAMKAVPPHVSVYQHSMEPAILTPFGYRLR